MNIAQLDKDIADLEAKLGGMLSQRVEVLEEQLKAAQDKVQALQSGGGAAIVEPPKKRAYKKRAPKAESAAPPKKRGKKRTRMSTEEVEKRITDTVKAAGKEGLSLKDISDQSGVNYQTCAKKLKEMSGFVKTGSLKDAKYSLK